MGGGEVGRCGDGRRAFTQLPTHPHANSRDSISTEKPFVVKSFPTVLKIRLFLRGSTAHIIGLYHAVSKCASCCELITGGGLGTVAI